MLRSAIICPDRDLSRNLQRSLGELSNIGLVRVMDHYPTSVELTRFVRAHAPQVIFLSLQSLPQALATATSLESTARGTQIIAIHPSYEPQLLLEIMRAGMREFLAMPFDRQLILESLTRVADILEKRPVSLEATDLLYSFLPSKAGVGTSTIALNASVALSKLEDTSTFLADLDLNSGMIRFMLKLENMYSIVDAAERSGDIDENFWPQLVTSLGNLDVMHAGKLNPNFRLESLQMRHLLEFIRRNYKVICFDLSGNLEKYSVEIMHESKRVFIVCTPEIPSLHLAREKFQYLQTLDLGDRVSILLNRCQKKSLLSPAQIEELLGLPVQLTFPNEYDDVNRAMAQGTHVDLSSVFGRQCSALANFMLDRKAANPEPAAAKKRFIEFFNVSPARYSFDTKKN